MSPKHYLKASSFTKPHPVTYLDGRIPLLLFHSIACLIPRSDTGYKYLHISKPSSEENIEIVLRKKVRSQLH